jgi:hypothetical protein
MTDIRARKQSFTQLVARLLQKPAGWDVDNPRRLHVFFAEPSDRKECMRIINTFRKGIERDIGGTLDVSFHSAEESTRLYPEIPGA